MLAVADDFETLEILVKRAAHCPDHAQSPLVVEGANQDRGPFAEVGEGGGRFTADPIRLPVPLEQGGEPQKADRVAQGGGRRSGSCRRETGRGRTGRPPARPAWGARIGPRRSAASGRPERPRRSKPRRRPWRPERCVASTAKLAPWPRRRRSGTRGCMIRDGARSAAHRGGEAPDSTGRASFGPLPRFRGRPGRRWYPSPAAVRRRRFRGSVL